MFFFFFTARNIKRKKGIPKDKKTVPKKTCRTDTADIPEVNTHPKNIISTSSHPSSYSVARASDECSEAGMQSFTNGVDNSSMLNTQPASQAADLEEVPSSSPHILQGCQRRQPHPDEDGKHTWHFCGKYLYQTMFLTCSQQP